MLVTQMVKSLNMRLENCKFKSDPQILLALQYVNSNIEVEALIKSQVLKIVDEEQADLSNNFFC